MGQVWGPFGIAEAAIVKGDDPKTALEAAAKAIRDGIGQAVRPSTDTGRRPGGTASGACIRRECKEPVDVRCRRDTQPGDGALRPRVPGGLIGKIILLAVFTAIAVWLAIPLIAAQN